MQDGVAEKSAIETTLTVAADNALIIPPHPSCPVVDFPVTPKGPE